MFFLHTKKMFFLHLVDMLDNYSSGCPRKRITILVIFLSIKVFIFQILLLRWYGSLITFTVLNFLNEVIIVTLLQLSFL